MHGGDRRPPSRRRGGPSPFLNAALGALTSCCAATPTAPPASRRRWSFTTRSATAAARRTSTLTRARLLEMEGHHAESLSEAEQSLRQFRLAGQRRVKPTPSTRSAGSTASSASTSWPSRTASRPLTCTANSATATVRPPLWTASATLTTTSATTPTRSPASGKPSACSGNSVISLTAAEVLIHLGDTHQAAGHPAAAQGRVRGGPGDPRGSAAPGRRPGPRQDQRGRPPRGGGVSAPEHLGVRRPAQGRRVKALKSRCRGLPSTGRGAGA